MIKMLRTACGIVLVLACLMAGSYSYKNPIQGFRDSPDPGVLFDGSNYYVVTTEGWDSSYFPIWQGKSIFNLTHVGFIFQKKPAWAVQNFWAPEIHIVGRSYMAYYTARDATGMLCIGVAWAEKPTGPYIDKGVPLLRNVSEGVIDATVYELQNGSIFLIYKVDGNAHGKPTQLYAIELTKDGKSLQGSPHFLFRDSLPWERGIVEAPWVLHHGDVFYIFYSSCGYANDCYSVGVARSKDLLGPYQKHPTPILHTRASQTENSWEGPGHCSVVTTLRSNYAIMYHAWPHGKIGSKRVLLVDKLVFENGWPKVGSDGTPSETEQPQF